MFSLKLSKSRFHCSYAFHDIWTTESIARFSKECMQFNFLKFHEILHFLSRYLESPQIIIKGLTEKRGNVANGGGRGRLVTGDKRPVARRKGPSCRSSGRMAVSPFPREPGKAWGYSDNKAHV